MLRGGTVDQNLWVMSGKGPPDGNGRAALRDAGYPVPEGDLKDRRRRRDYAALADDGE